MGDTKNEKVYNVVVTIAYVIETLVVIDSMTDHSVQHYLERKWDKIQEWHRNRKQIEKDTNNMLFEAWQIVEGDNA